MTVEIPVEFQQFVHNAIDAGSYKDEAEVVGQALRLLQNRQQRVEELRREIQPALDQLDRGEGIEIRSEEELRMFFEDIERRGLERLEAKRSQR